MSTMITGGSNFPHRRMEKKQNTVSKRLNELVDYGDKAEKYVLPVKSNAIKTGKVDTISKLKEKLKELETTHEKMKDINKILRKFQNKKYSQEEREAGVIEALEKIGYSEKDTRKNFLGEKKLPSFMLSNSNANIKRIKDRIAEEEKLKGQEEQSFPFDGGTIYFRPEINKVQIEFDGKPEKEIRDFLKKAGHAFKWSPRNKVWQRQLNTYYSLNKKDLAEFLGIDPSKGLNAAWHDKGTIEREALDNCSRLEKGYKYNKGGKIEKVDPEPKKEKPTIKPAKKPVIKAAAAAVKKPAKIAVKKPVIKVVKDPFTKKYGVTPEESVTWLNRGVTVEHEGESLEFYRDLLILNNNDNLKLKKNKIFDLQNFTIDFDNSLEIKKATVLRKKNEDSLSIIAGKDDLRPNMSGIYVDENYYVATDAHKLVKIKADPPKNKIGKIININPKVSKTTEPFIDGKYINYDSVIPNYTEDQFSNYFDLDKILNEVNTLIKLTDPIRGIMILYLADNLAVHPNILLPVLQVFKANGSKKIKIGAAKSNRSILIKSDNGNEGIVMPIFINGKQDQGIILNYKILDIQIGLSAPDNYSDLFNFKRKNGFTKIIDDTIATAVKNVIDTSLSKVKNSKIRNMATTRGNDNSEFFNVPGEVGKFLQAVEKKPKQSVVITIDGHQGAGKTTTLYKFMNAFASGKNRSLFASLEEHPDSSLAKEKEENYINPENRSFIDTIGELESKEEFYSLIENYDIIFIDSWQKLLRMIGNIRLDEDLRKHFDGKVFVVIFQQTTTGRTKGGAEVVFDGDIIIKMVKGDKFSENYAYFDKNRYTKVPIETLRYNIAGGNVYNPEEAQEDPINSRIENPESGRLIATPVI